MADLLYNHPIWLSMCFSTVDEDALVRDGSRFQVEVIGVYKHSHGVVDVHCFLKKNSSHISCGA